MRSKRDIRARPSLSTEKNIEKLGDDTFLGPRYQERLKMNAAGFDFDVITRPLSGERVRRFEQGYEN